MKRWTDIFKDELKLLIKDKSILLTCLVAPILYALFIGSIYMEKEVSDIPLAVVDMDHSSLSRKISQLVDSSEKVAVTGHFSNMEEAMYYFNDLKVQGILLIPKDFQKKAMNLDEAKVELILNNTKFLTSNELNKGVQQVLLTVAGGVRLQYFISNKVPVELAKQQAQPILPVIKSIYNATNNYGDYLLPILLILILQQTLVIGFGQSAVHEFKHGLLTNLREVDFHSFFKVFSAKSFYYMVLYSVYFFIFFKVIFQHYNLTFKGPLLLHMVLGILFLLVVVMYVIFLSSFFKTSIGWTEVMAFSTYPLFLVSGYSWPVEAMPKFLQFFTSLLPATPYYKMFNMLSVQGAAFKDIRTDFIHLLLLVLFGYILLYIRFKYMRYKALRSDAK
jgi:ABC-2 type transport system permease protein